jgi:hypothetical protein
MSGPWLTDVLACIADGHPIDPIDPIDELLAWTRSQGLTA